MQTTPPDKLVPSFRFVSSSAAAAAGESSTAPSPSKSRSLRTELDSSYSAWRGKAVFAQTPAHPQPKASGSVDSPISVRSSPSPPAQDLPRPRGRVAYSPEARTAFTPPRPAPPRSNTSQLDDPRSDAARSTASRPITAEPSVPKTLHPFFNRREVQRSKSVPLPPPPSQKPRFIPQYSSTSESQSQSTQTESQSSTRTDASQSGTLPLRALKQERVFSAGWSADEENQAMIRESFQEMSISDRSARPGSFRAPDAQFPASPSSFDPPSNAAKSDVFLRTQVQSALQRASPEDRLPPRASARPMPSRSSLSSLSLAASRKEASRPLPLFSYITFRPASSPHHRPPKIAYTTSEAEADDLLACLKGPVLGLDLEWPISGSYKVQSADGTVTVKKIGMEWNAESKTYKFSQGRTALVQLCDENLIVLIHLKDRGKLPRKAIELLANPEITKVGVAIGGDAHKLLRDFPNEFPNGVRAILELTKVARKVDPINTGPGAKLISLADLCSAYLGRRLAKEQTVRGSDWSSELNSVQKAYAADDVYSSLQIYNDLKQLGERRGIKVVPRSLSLDYGGPPPAKAPATAKRARPVAPPTAATPDGLADPATFRASRTLLPRGAWSRPPAPPGRLFSGVMETSARRGIVDPGDIKLFEAAAQASLRTPTPPPPTVSAAPNHSPPRAIQALNMFVGGMSFQEIAEERCVKLETAQQYVLLALEDLPGNHLSVEDKTRLVRTFDQSSYLRGPHFKMWRGLVQEVEKSEAEQGKKAHGRRKEEGEEEDEEEGEEVEEGKVEEVEDEIEENEEVEDREQRQSLQRPNGQKSTG